MLRDYFGIAELGAKDDIEQLVSSIETMNSSDRAADGTAELSRVRFAAETLAACGDDAAHLIFVSLAEGRRNASWLIYALGKSKSPKATEYFEELARARWRDETVLLALSMKGEAGRKVMQRVAADEEHPLKAAAMERLKGRPEVPRPPKPQRGSLPKALP